MDDDKDDEYMLAELPEYSKVNKNTADNDPVYDKPRNPYTVNKELNATGSSSLCKVLHLLLVILLVVIMLVVLILQIVTVYDIRIEPSVCTMSPSSSADTTSMSQIGDNTRCNCSSSSNSDTANTAAIVELMNRLNQFLNQTSEILNSYEEQTAYIQNGTDELEDISQSAEESALRIKDMIVTLSNLKENSITTEALVNDVLAMVDEVLKVQNLSLSSKDQEPKSCQDIRNAQPDSPSGYYHIHSEIVYCEMGELCGSEGGWTRIGYLDMSDSTVNCPDGFRLYEVSGVRACGRPVGGPSCSSAKFESHGISYTEVCGKVVGYQYASPDAVDTRFVGPEFYNNINSYYADGALITQGYPRQHLWSYIAGVSDSQYDNGNCPCNTPPGGTQLIRPFMGDDYYCESGNPYGWTYKLYTDDPLWDGDGCGTQEGNCCAVPNQPWFYRSVNASTDYVELRVCGDEHTIYDDVPVSFYVIFVK